MRDGEDAAEISLAENIVRLPMHPADQFAAFKVLADDGKGPEEIAARFGCSPATVRQRLRLACVSPALLDIYRADDMALDQLMAFTVSDDHGAQETAWAELPTWNRHPDTIRRILTRAHVEASDRRARFVGIEAYTAAGGPVLRDLFTPEHDGYLTDPALFDRLAAERLEREAETIRAEGWKWVEIMPELDYACLQQCRRVYPETQPPDKTQQAEIDRLSAAYDVLVAEHGDDLSDAVAAEIAAISDNIDALSQETERWASDDLARAGAVIGIGHAGRLAIERGLVRPEDMPKALAETTSRKDRSGRSKSGGGGQLPAALTETLTAQRTAALRAVLASDPDTALAAVVHSAALPVFYGPFAAESCLRLSLDSADLSAAAEGIAESRAMTSLAERHGLWRTPCGIGRSRRRPRPGSICWPTAPPCRSMPSRGRMSAVTDGCDMPTGSPRRSGSTWPNGGSQRRKAISAGFRRPASSQRLPKGSRRKPPKISPGSKRMR